MLHPGGVNAASRWCKWCACAGVNPGTPAIYTSRRALDPSHLYLSAMAIYTSRPCYLRLSTLLFTPLDPDHLRLSTLGVLSATSSGQGSPIQGDVRVASLPVQPAGSPAAAGAQRFGAAGWTSTAKPPHPSLNPFPDWRGRGRRMNRITPPPPTAGTSAAAGGRPDATPRRHALTTKGLR